MPPHDTYIEAYLGGGAIMQRKAPALRNIGIDLNERALERLQCDYPVEKVHGCAHRFPAAFPFTGRELVYSDPLYLHPTRSSGRRARHTRTIETAAIAAIAAVTTLALTVAPI
jgi:site-specific DNA-adenine methylase